MNERVDCDDNSNTEAVEKKLLGGFGKGILKQNGIGILSDTLVPGDYEYKITSQQGQFSLLLNHFLKFLDNLLEISPSTCLSNSLRFFSGCSQH